MAELEQSGASLTQRNASLMPASDFIAHITAALDALRDGIQQDTERDEQIWIAMCEIARGATIH